MHLDTELTRPSGRRKGFFYHLSLYIIYWNHEWILQHALINIIKSVVIQKISFILESVSNNLKSFPWHCNLVLCSHKIIHESILEKKFNYIEKNLIKNKIKLCFFSAKKCFTSVLTSCSFKVSKLKQDICQQKKSNSKSIINSPLIY